MAPLKLNFDILEEGNFWAYGMPDNMRISLRVAMITLGLTEEEEIETIYGDTNTCCEWKEGGGPAPSH